MLKEQKSQKRFMLLKMQSILIYMIELIEYLLIKLIASSKSIYKNRNHPFLGGFFI